MNFVTIETKHHSGSEGDDEEDDQSSFSSDCPSNSSEKENRAAANEGKVPFLLYVRKIFFLFVFSVYIILFFIWKIS